jgi:hypothetical protein
MTKKVVNKTSKRTGKKGGIIPGKPDPKPRKSKIK